MLSAMCEAIKNIHLCINKSNMIFLYSPIVWYIFILYTQAFLKHEASMKGRLSKSVKCVILTNGPTRPDTVKGIQQRNYMNTCM